jgi:hypothetical protein
MTKIIPATITAGDTFKLEDISITDYLSTEYTLCFALRGKTPGNYTATSNPDGTYTFNILHTTTKNFYPGSYRYVLYVDKSVEQYTIETGAVEIVQRVDLSTKTDQRSYAKRVLDAIEATIENRATSDQQAYTINGRSLTRISIQDLLKLREYYKELVAKENTATDSRKNKIKVVM